MTLVLTDESKKKLERYEELWSKIIDLIRSKTNNSDDYDEKYMKINFNSNDLPLKRILELRKMIIVFSGFFHRFS